MRPRRPRPWRRPRRSRVPTPRTRYWPTSLRPAWCARACPRISPRLRAASRWSRPGWPWANGCRPATSRRWWRSSPAAPAATSAARRSTSTAPPTCDRSDGPRAKPLALQHGRAPLEVEAVVLGQYDMRSGAVQLLRGPIEPGRFRHELAAERDEIGILVLQDRLGLPWLDDGADRHGRNARALSHRRRMGNLIPGPDLRGG